MLGQVALVEDERVEAGVAAQSLRGDPVLGGHVDGHEAHAIQAFEDRAVGVKAGFVARDRVDEVDLRLQLGDACEGGERRGEACGDDEGGAHLRAEA